MNKNLIEIIKEEKIYPILRCKDPQVAVDTAKALIDGGIKVLEINAEHPCVYNAVREISNYAGVCAGGIITSMQAQAAIEAGAKIISSPIFHMNLAKISKNSQIPYIAGTSTANEAYSAWKARIPLIKIFPITAMGGAMYIEDLLRPMPFLQIMPIGNVKLDEVKDYINAGAAAVGVGRDFYDGYSYSEITKRAQKIISELKG